MPTNTADRLILAGCFWLMTFGLRLIRLGNRISPTARS